MAEQKKPDKKKHKGSSVDDGMVRDARAKAFERAEELLKKSGEKGSGAAEKAGVRADVSKAEYEKLKEQLKEWETLKDRLLRQAADYENARKRLQREKDEFVRYAHGDLIMALLPILRNLERAVDHSQEKRGENDPLVVGVELVIKEVRQMLERYGVRRIESVGKVFDPHIHEAVAHIASKEPAETVIEESDSGYMYHDRLIRPAKVVVSKGTESDAERPGKKQGETGSAKDSSVPGTQPDSGERGKKPDESSTGQDSAVK